MISQYLSKNRLNLCILSCLIFLLYSVPLFFSTNTHSVFEVGKLLVLRIGILLTILLILLRACLHDPNKHVFQITPTQFIFFGFHWNRSIFDIPIIIWILSLMVSTVFSKNVLLSIYGTYDRWEGLITSILYIILFIIFFKHIC